MKIAHLGASKYYVSLDKVQFLYMAPTVLDYQVTYLDYHTVCILTSVLKGHFLLLSYVWGVQLIRGVLHLDFSLSCWFRGIRVLFFVF